MRLNLGDLAQQAALLAESNLESRESLIAGLLATLIDAGFDRARYYDAADNGFGERRLVLVAATKDADLGLQMDIQASSLYLCGDPGAASICDGPELLKATGGDPPDWYAANSLQSRTWVDIPVRALGTEVGLLAADWMGPRDWLGEEHRHLLTLFGRLAGGMLSLGPEHRARQTVGRILGSQTESITPESMTPVLRLIGGSLNAASSALFEYRWATGRLHKVAEAIDQRYETSREPFFEEYSVGEYLTGRAWTDDDLRYISDFRKLEHDHGDLVSPASLARHRALFGDIRSVMYAKIGAREPRYLLRFMNRADDPRLPFLTERGGLAQFVDALNTELSATVAEQRLASLQQLALTSVRHPEQPEMVVRAMERSLMLEGVDSFGVLAHSTGGHYFTFGELFIGGHWRSIKRGTTPWRSESLYAMIVDYVNESASPSPCFIDIRPEHVGLLRSELAGRAHGVLAIPVSTGESVGCLFAPMMRNPLSGGKPRMMPRAVERTLTAYTRVAVTAIASRSSYLTAEGARRVLGFIGHELSTPLAMLGDIGVEAITASQLAIQRLPEQTPDTRALFYRLEDTFRRLGTQRHQVAQLLAVAPLVSQESGGLLQVHFRKTDLAGVIVSAREQALRGREDARTLSVTLNESARELDQVVCDGALVQQVLVNLLNNAIKYSLPRHRSEPKTIRIIANQQRAMTIIQVENWGIGVSEDEFESIFEPFVRGRIEDERKAIRGMGLGLFLSRRIMAAHGGSVFCASSVSTLNDPVRLARMEGYLTTFEVRIPHNLTEGTHTIDLNARSEG